MHLSRRFFLPVVAILIATLLAGCGGISGPGTGTPRKIRVVEAPGEKIPPQFHGKFVQRLERELYDENFTRGNDLVLTWKCTEVNAGNRALRYFVGFGAGAGVVVIQATLADAKGHVLGTKELKGVQTIGMFGGSFDSAIEMAADGTADFAAAHAYPKPLKPKR
jgi:hypothetical protein